MITLRRAAQLARFYYLQRVKGFAVPDEPHFDPASTPEFIARLKQAKSYLEFGSGGSTLLAARLGVPTITLENDRFFARAVQKKLPAGAQHEMIVVHLGVTAEWGKPLFLERTPARLKRWRRYVDAAYDRIAEDGHAFPDLILVDGRFRRACTLEGARRAALAGCNTTICIDDYIGRESYEAVEQYLGKPFLAGRMAIFDVDAAKVDIPLAVVDEAAADFA